MLHFLSLLMFCRVFADGSCKLAHSVGLPLRLRGQQRYNLHFENWESFAVFKQQEKKSQSVFLGDL